MEISRAEIIFSAKTSILKPGANFILLSQDSSSDPVKMKI